MNNFFSGLDISSSKSFEDQSSALPSTDASSSSQVSVTTRADNSFITFDNATFSPGNVTPSNENMTLSPVNEILFLDSVSLSPDVTLSQDNRTTDNVTHSPTSSDKLTQIPDDAALSSNNNFVKFETKCTKKTLNN